MAPRKQRGSAGGIREYKLRLPLDISARVEAKAKELIKPQNRIIINELAAFPDLERQRTFAENLSALDNLLANYGSRITWLDLSEGLLKAVDAVLKADGATAVQAAIDKLRVQRNAMLRMRR
jgi:hypothetical protein